MPPNSGTELATLFRIWYRGQLTEATPVHWELEKHLERIINDAKAQWPDILLPDVMFVRYIAEKLPPNKPPQPALLGLCSGDIYLACACLHGNDQGFTCLEKYVFTKIPSFIKDIDASSSFSDDVAQILRMKLLIPGHEGPAKIGMYDGRTPLKNWIRVAARRVAIDLHRQIRGRPSELLDALDSYVVKPRRLLEDELDRTQFRGILHQSLAAGIGALSDEQINLLRLYYVKDRSLEEIAVVFRLNQIGRAHV